MLWYLLYPIRGTTQPPRLSSTHPIRRAFYRHGKTTAQHWLLAMMVSVAIAMGFSYPTVLLLADDPTAGLATFPRHVWTTVEPLQPGVDSAQADVEMRQIWVHGSFMKALDKQVLTHALHIQETLVGRDRIGSDVPSLNDKLRSSSSNWAYHSPLMYWNNTDSLISSDSDILRTINDKVRSTSPSLNVALRPASVFAGKRFKQAKLVAADALVITLMNKADDRISKEWQSRMGALATGICEDCILFPEDGHITRNRVYEFGFTPLSLRENMALTIAYCVMALYVLLSLRRLKAFHSRFGLFVAAVFQTTCSILCSITCCSLLLKINLSSVPSGAYPFIIFVLGIESMFRLVLGIESAMPATMATELRIANGLGDVGPISVATALQNLLMLSMLSRVVSPGVAAFCVFACIAALFDTFFLLTFFVAVLAVDIRRFELQDALAKANQTRHKRKPSPAQHHTWFDAFLRGRSSVPVSTRMAGTAVTCTFVLSLNYHFFEHKEKATSLMHLLHMAKKGGPPMLNEFDSFAPPPINASLTPGQWMRMQDFDSAKEVMRLAKPGADSFMVRVFAPLIIVLPGSDRTDIEVNEVWTAALRSFAIHHFYPVAIAVVFGVTFVAVLMNFLLYTDHEDEPRNEDILEESDAVHIQSIALPHRLDIVKLFASAKGDTVSVGLDRSIAISTRASQRIVCFSADSVDAIQWPVRSIAIDDGCEWIACQGADDQILTYCCVRASFTGTALSYPDDNPPVLFRFVRLPAPEGSQLHLIILTSGGRLLVKNIEADSTITTRLEHSPLLGAAIQEISSQGRRLVVFTDQATLVVYSWANGGWIQSITQTLPIPTLYGRLTGTIRLQQNTGLGADVCLVITFRHVIFVDPQSFAIIGLISAGEDECPLIGVILGQAAQCPACSSVAVRSISLVSEGTTGNECTIATRTAPTESGDPMCIRDDGPACHSLKDATMTTIQRISKPGAWSLTTTSQAILGLRRRKLNTDNAKSTIRNRKRRRSNGPADEGRDEWQAYRVSVDSELEEVDVETDHTHGLYVNHAGPVVALDAQTIAVAFGNSVKIISSRRGPRARRPTGRSLERPLEPLKES